MHAYIAKVTSVEKRKVKAKSNLLSDSAGWIYPLNIGHLKTPAPDVDDHVLVLSLDDTNIARFYIPVFPESEADSDSDDNTTFFIGKEASEAAALGDTTKAKIEQLIDELLSAMTIGNMGIPIQTIGPSSISGFTAIKSALADILSEKIKVI